jgi:membrane protein
MSLKSWWTILKQTVSEFSEDNVLRLSAALAYYSMFSIGPLLAIVVGLAGLAFGSESVRHQIEQQLRGIFGGKAADIVVSMMSAQKKGTGLITAIVGLVALLFGAAGVFGQLQDSLNTIWEVKANPKAGIWSIVRNRFLSFSMVLGIGFLLLVSMALSTALSALTKSIGNSLPMAGWLGHGLDFLVSFGVVTLLFAMIFKFLPDVKVPWSKVWIGAIGTTLLFTIGKILLGMYLGRASTTSAYGAAGSVIVILMWIYYASVILFFGAEFTQVYAKKTGAVIRPSHYAVPVTADERAQQGMVNPSMLEQAPASGASPAPPVASGQPTKTLALRTSPAEVIHRNALGVVSLMLATGFVAGTFFQLKTLRQALKIYRKVRKAAEAVA